MKYRLLLVVFCALFLPTTSRADPGGVDLLNGGRVNGDVMAVLPGDHVSVRLADGTTLSVAWADIRRVQDGARTYDQTGLVQSIPPPPAAVPPEDIEAPPVRPPLRGRVAPASAYRPAMGTPESVRLMIAYEALPQRVGTAWLMVGGIIFSMAGTGMFFSGVGMPCYAGCGFNIGMGVGGAINISVGMLMTVRSLKRSRRRARGMEELSQPGAFAIDADLDRGAFVPRLRLAF